MTIKKLCIYHGNCPDGFAAAWAVRHALGDTVEFHAGVHQQAPPEVSGREVILVDFSYKKSVLESMLETAAGITILDHHVSAQQDLAELLQSGKISGLFDMARSGAMLTWEWFNPDSEAPQLIRHIQDRDLWQFKLAGTREIMAGLSSWPYDFSLWDRFMQNRHGELEKLKSDGIAIERKLQKDVDELIATGVMRMTIGGFDVPVLNASSAYVSEAGHRLSHNEPFAACYWDHADGRSFSLRSAEGGVDVAAVAVQYGGGGHRHAAGFTVARGWQGDKT